MGFKQFRDMAAQAKAKPAMKTATKPVGGFGAIVSAIKAGTPGLATARKGPGLALKSGEAPKLAPGPTRMRKKRGW